MLSASIRTEDTIVNDDIVNIIRGGSAEPAKTGRQRAPHGVAARSRDLEMIVVLTSASYCDGSLKTEISHTVSGHRSRLAPPPLTTHPEAVPVSRGPPPARQRW